MNELANKHDSGKVMVELVSPSFIIAIGQVLTYGAKKYGPQNWKKGLPWLRIYGSVMRHLLAWAGGEDNDPESGLSHLQHASTNLMFLIEWKESHPELDNRKAV